MLLITGATGFIGSHLVKKLGEAGEHPRCLVRNPERAQLLLPAQRRDDFAKGDTTQPETLIQALNGIETVVHCAFITADRKQREGNNYQITNVGGTRNLIQAAKKAGVKKIVMVSGLGTQPEKPGSYMQGRYEAEQVLINSGLDWTIVQPSVLFGKGSPFITGLSELVKSAPVLPLIGGGEIRFQPIHVDDVVTIISTIITQREQTSKHTYTIGGPEYYTLSRIFDEIQAVLGTKKIKVYTPLFAVKIGAFFLNALMAKPPITPAALALFQFDNITDLDSVEQQFGFQPRDFHQTIQTEGL